jgi:hypothetical protein
MAQIEKSLAKVLNQIEGITGDVLWEACEPIFDKALEYVPYDTGKLHDSGFYELTETASGPRLTIGFAAQSNPPYAVLVHENMEFFHEPPTRAKFLQSAIEEEGPKVASNIQRMLKRRLNP